MLRNLELLPKNLPPALATALLGALPALTLATGCSSSDGSGGGGTQATGVDFLIQDAPLDDLSSFALTVTALRLSDGVGGATPNLLAGSVDVEFLGLQDDWLWLASVMPPAGTWQSVEVEFAPGSAAARATDGTPVAVTELGTQLVASFPEQLVIQATGYDRILIDLDLSESLTGDVGSPPILFDPEGSSSSSNGSSSATIDEIKGLVQVVQQGSSKVVIDAFVDDDLNLALGPVEVSVTGQTLLLMENKAPFASQAAFFTALQVGQTLLEVHGALGSSGVVQATRIEIEDQFGGGITANSVEIEGRIVDLDSVGMTLELLIQEIEKGSSLAGPVLSGLGGPATITVAWDAQTVFLDDESNQLLTSTSLAVGGEVDCKFPSFMSEPFLASEVELEDVFPEFEGFVKSTAGLLTSMIVNLKASDPAVLSGLVASTATDVTVDTSGAGFTLDVDDEPPLSPSLVQAGLRVDIYGTLSGSPTSPNIAATLIEVRPGEFEGNVMSVNPGLSFFQAGIDSIDDPFGTNVTGGPIDVLIDPSATFDGDASSANEFFALFANLAQGEVLEIEVEGLGTGAANEVLAFEIEARVE